MARRVATHEDYHRHDAVKMGSERGFGLTFAVVFALIGAYPALSGGEVRIWSLVVAAAFAVAAFAAPAALRPLNRAWFRLGMALGAVVTPVVMAFLYYSTVTPIALLMRALGKRPLPLDFDREAKTYWIPRDPPGPAPESMRKQF